MEIERNELCTQEAQLMLTNPRDAFKGQSRSQNIVPFHMLGIVSSCAIITLSLRRAGFLYVCTKFQAHSSFRSMRIGPAGGLSARR